MDVRDGGLSPATTGRVIDSAASPSLRTPYFQSDRDTPSRGDASPLPPKLQLEAKLNFQYRGDIFGQHGVYSDASLYMSRLPSSHKGSILRPKAGAAYLKLAPMTPQAAMGLPQQQEKPTGSTKSNKVNRKRQYALAVEAMASSPGLRSSLLVDNVTPSLLSLLRTKDSTTLASCIATLCYLSSDPLGREALLMNNALVLLTATTPSGDGSTSRQTLVHNYLATLANLTIEDAYESVFVKEKALESLMKHRTATSLSERMCVSSILNLSCQTFSYPRVDEVIHAIHELTRDPALSIEHCEMLSRALYNLSCTRPNQVKFVDGDIVGVLRALITWRTNSLFEPDPSQQTVEATRLNALMTMWHLAENPQCCRALTRPECIRALVETLRSCSEINDRLKCSLMILSSLATDDAACQRLGSVDLLDGLAELAMRLRDRAVVPSKAGDEAAEMVAAVYRLIALILSAPAALEHVSQPFLGFLLAVAHGAIRLRLNCLRYVLFSLASILWWNDNDENDRRQLVAATAVNRIPAVHSRARLDELLDDPAILDPLLAYVVDTDLTSSEVLLQMLLLYNLSFRYNKLDVARRTSSRLKELATTSSNETVLAIVCGTLFSLSQEFETHCELHAAGVLDVLPLVVERCSHDPATQTLCLDVVCIVFDGRMLARSDLVALMTLVAPSLVTLCEAGSTTLRASCAACFARFACIDECRPVMGQHGVIRALAILANEEDTQTLRLCVSAYSHLSRDTAICAQLIGSGIIKSLTFLAAAPEEAVRRACAMTLCNLSTSEDNIGALAKAGALKALLVISCVKSNDPETRRICMKAVMNLLRLPANIPLLCEDGLVWAFGLFTSGMEPKDYDIMCDAFCALAFYPATRKGIAKASFLSAAFQVFESPSASAAATIKLLKGISNVLCDLPHAAQLLHAGVLTHLVAIVGRAVGADERDPAEGEARMLVAQVLVLIFQSCPDAEHEFAEPEMLHTLETLLRTDHGDCGRCCSILLYQMSLHTLTRTRLVVGIDGQDSTSLICAVPALFVKVTRDTQVLLVRLLYNCSCDAELRRVLDTAAIVGCLIAALLKKIAALAIDVAAYGAGLLRNLSCEPSSHHALMDEQSTTLLQRLFEADDDATKEDVAVCLCNLFMGHINSSALLARGLLPMVLWLCSSCASPDSRALGSTVVRKIALAPGNAQLLVDGGVISHAALLMQDCKCLFVKTNCIATFCCVSRKPGVPALLASYGVIASVLELLGAQQGSDPLFEAMCVDLLSALAEFARADDAVESKLASILFQLIENNDVTVSPAVVSTGAAAEWQTDRSFLRREAGSPLSPPTVASTHTRAVTKPPMLRHTLYPIRFAGYAVDVPPMASTIELRTIEPIMPSVATIGEVVGTTDAVSARPPSVLEFSPLPMFPKLCTPFAPVSFTCREQQSEASHACGTQFIAHQF